MKLAEGVEWGVHAVTLLATLPPDTALPAAKLAEFHGVPPAYLAKSLQALARAGIVESVPGRRGGYRMIRSADDVTLLDIVEAIEGNESSFKCTEIRKRGPSRVANRLYAPMCGIAEAMHRADQAWRDELHRTTVADVLGQLWRTVPGEAAVKAVGWLREAVN